MEGQEERQVCPTCPTAHGASSHQALGTLPLIAHTRDTTTHHMHRLGSHQLQAGSKQHWEPKATLWTSRSLSSQTMWHFLHYFPSRASLKWHAICIQSEKPHFVIRKLKFPASCPQPCTPWTLTSPSPLCAGSAASPASTDDPMGPCFLKPHFVEIKGYCAIPLSMLITGMI